MIGIGLWEFGLSLGDNSETGEKKFRHKNFGIARATLAQPDFGF
jgi:hypothetical protein